MRKNILYYGIIVGLALMNTFSSCRKDSGFYNDKASVKSFDGNIYEFLKSHTGVYDSFLYVMDRLNLTDSLKEGSYTVFAPTNSSFETAIADVNRLRKSQQRSVMYLSNIPIEQLDSLACRYIIRGEIPADSMNTQDGIFFYDIRYGYMMHGKLDITNAQGFVKGGPQEITFADAKGVIYTRQWSTARTVTINIKTSNGYVNVLDRNHVFGFGEFNERVNPTHSTPFFGTPLPVPGTIGFEYYDKGGERVAYHDDDVANHGTKFRPTEGVDIRDAEGDDRGFFVGWTNPNEWMNYTVDIADTGYYKVIIRASAFDQGGSIDLLLDKRPVSGAINLISFGSGTDDYGNSEAIIGPLLKGKHVLRVHFDYTGFNLRWMKIIPYNKPFPVPGTISAEDYNKGGEGVGYHDLDGGNNGGQYRPSEGVDIEQSAAGEGYNVGWTNGGEWLNYDIEVKKSGQYIVNVRVGSSGDPNGGHRFHVEFDGADLTGPMVCPNTGDYHNWTDVSATVYLEKGNHTMRFYEETGGYNFRLIKIDAVH